MHGKQESSLDELTHNKIHKQQIDTTKFQTKNFRDIFYFEHKLKMLVAIYKNFEKLLIKINWSSNIDKPRP